MKQILSLIIAAGMASAEGQTDLNPPSKFSGELLGGHDPVLTQQERTGVEITRAWRDKSYETLVGSPGYVSTVKFKFDESLPSIVCAILQVTDIELQAGEAISHINLGDNTRWSVETAMSGSGTEQMAHLIVKPRDIGLATSLVVMTDRRTYHLLLVSDANDFMHAVSFLYGGTTLDTAPPLVVSASPAPTPSLASASPPKPHKLKSEGKAVRVASKDTPDNADEHYAVSGKADWKPVSVYSKDGKTYFEMPSSVRHKEAPVLFEVKKAGWFKQDKVLVNYRVHGRWYVADKVIDNAVLVSGVGSGQDKVSIRHDVHGQ